MSKYDIAKTFKSTTTALNNNAEVDSEYNSLFGLHTSRDIITELDLNLLKPHPNDRFKPYTEEKLKELAGSIKKVGLLEPVIVRPCGGEYEILSGKNRSNAEIFNGRKKIKAFIRDVDDDTAIMIMTDSNLKHRETLLPSERGWAYRMQLEVRNRQGKRTDLEENSTSVHGERKTSRKEVADLNEVRESDIQRYIRLTYLIPTLLELVDNKKSYIMAGVSFSYFDEESQTAIYQYHQEIGFSKMISKQRAGEIREEYERKNKSLNIEQIREMLEGKKQKQSKVFSINRNKFKQFTDKLPSDQELENLFFEFLNNRFNG